jgi:hypothetical protein
MPAKTYRIGRNQRAARRLLIIASRPLSTREIAEALYRTTQLVKWQMEMTWRAVQRFAVRVGKCGYSVLLTSRAREGLRPWVLPVT